VKRKPKARGSWPIGMPVLIEKANDSKWDGSNARLVRYEAVRILGHVMSVPVFKLTGKSGKLLRGYECWWRAAHDRR
jgi:hypothetical protein